MTTAHRPTFNAAIGGEAQGGGRYIAGVTRTHVHDLPGQMSIKRRQDGQQDEGGRDMLRPASQGSLPVSAGFDRTR